jgi:predicted ferric reductase
VNWGSGSAWEFIWHFLVIFAWIAYLLVLFQILTDLFWRDHKTSGVVKAIWVVFLFVIPWFTALVYLIFRGQGMSVRAHEAAVAAKKQTDDYIREAAGRSPAEEIAHAKELLDAGTINQGEYESLKAKALGTTVSPETATS